VLLVMDVQQGIVARFSDTAGYLDRLAHAIAAARGAAIPVAYVQVGFRSGHRRSARAIRRSRRSDRPALSPARTRRPGFIPPSRPARTIWW
jgi:nicotinamidase-related amidase